MATINENFLSLKPNYLFKEISDRVIQYQSENPDKKIIRLGIGDVTIPLSNTVAQAMLYAVNSMKTEDGFRGYGPERGYSFLIEKIIHYDFKNRGISFEENEIFVSDGSKCDSANIQEIFNKDIKVAIGDPVYPVYLDTNIMAGRLNNISYMVSNQENNFIPELPKTKIDLLYLCYPNNPTGTVLKKEELKKWVKYAKENQSIILYDSAYEAFITEDEIPHSIYEIEGAKEVAIEFRSFSKTAGFTGIRCAYIVIPKELKAFDTMGKEYSVNQFWARRHSTKFNGVSYITQRGAEACYSELGRKEINENIKYYLNNAKILRDSMQKLGYDTFGGLNSPYVWVKVSSFYFFLGFF